jgi:hypothetical protein
MGLILGRVSLFGYPSLAAGLARVGVWPGHRPRRICGFLRSRVPTADEHHAAGQDEQERHHQNGEDLRVGHSNGLCDAVRQR